MIICSGLQKSFYTLVVATISSRHAVCLSPFGWTVSGHVRVLAHGSLFLPQRNVAKAWK